MCQACSKEMRSPENSSIENKISGGNKMQCPHISSIMVQNIKSQIVWQLTKIGKGFSPLQIYKLLSYVFRQNVFSKYIQMTFCP